MSEDIEAALWEGRTPEACRLAWRVPRLLAFAATASTNDIAMRLAGAGEPAGTTVLADRQTRGRGSAGRPWTDTGGASLLMTVVLRAARATDPSTMPLRVGLAVARAIADTSGVRALLKWPNDIVADDDRKIAGILCEGASGTGQAWVAAGIGVNVAQRPADFDADLRETATSIAMLGGGADRFALAGRILDLLRPFAVRPPPLDPATLDALESLDALRGRRVTVNGDVACTAEGIARDGALLVRRDDRVLSVRSGTVRPLDRTGARGEEEAHNGPAPTTTR